MSVHPTVNTQSVTEVTKISDDDNKNDNGAGSKINTKKRQYKTTHTRSTEGKKKKKAKYKEKQKEKKKAQFMEKIEKDLEKERRIRELESRNALLTRRLHSLKPNSTQILSRYSLPKTAVDSTLNKRVNMNQMIKVKPIEFKEEELKLLPTVVGEGVYGKLKIGELTNFQQNVADCCFELSSLSFLFGLIGWCLVYFNRLYFSNFFPIGSDM
ncbi:DNA ligase 1-like [Clytia hemisphaerica]|uniref:DNA ligase 1-like n=1 Tax=Clytia hemisphaerica TaxID=252671 RepID=UPI0034D3EAA0